MTQEEFIKWLCDKAEGFRWHEGFSLCVESPNKRQYSVFEIWESEDFSPLHKPLLLQKAIEGVNLIPGIWIEILLSPDTGGSIAWKPYIKSDNFQGLNGDLFLWVDHAKEAALKYIYEQEKKND